MALAVVQHVTADSILNTATVAVTVSATVAGNLIVVGCANVYGTTVSSVTDNKGNQYSQANSAAALSTTGTLGTDIWYCPNSIGGVTTVTITFAGASAANKDGFVWEVSGWLNCGFDVGNGLSNGVNAGATNTGASVTTRGSTGFAVGVCATVHTITANPKAGNEFTSGGDIQAATGNAGCSFISSSAAAHRPDWTDTTGANYCASTAAFWEEPILYFPALKG